MVGVFPDIRIGLGLVLSAAVIWCVYSHIGRTIVGATVALELCIAFPPLILVALFVYWLKVDAERSIPPDYELMFVRQFYPNAYRHPMHGRIVH